MTSKDNGESQDKELLGRYQRASDAQTSAPSATVRAAILAESRRVAEQFAKQGSPPAFDTSRPAANDSRWKITAFGTLGAALLAALLIAPRYWGTLPAAKERAAQTASPQITPSAAPAPKLESVTPTQVSDDLQDVIVTSAKRRRGEALAPAPALASTPAFGDAAPKSAPRAYAGREEKTPLTASARSADSSIGEANDRLFKRVQTPGLLQSAVESGDLVQATALLDKGVAVNARDAQGRTPLMLAISQGQLEVVRLLLQRGADPNATDNSGKTPLQQATDHDLKDIVALLKGAGAR